MYEKETKKLKILRKELKTRIKGIKKTLTTEKSKDWAEAAVESENDEVLEGLFSESSQELLQINHALQRIDQGKYGECNECGSKIKKKRLKIMPYTTLCIECAQQLEFEYNKK